MVSNPFVCDNAPYFYEALDVGLQSLLANLALVIRQWAIKTWISKAHFDQAFKFKLSSVWWNAVCQQNGSAILSESKIQTMSLEQLDIAFDYSFWIKEPKFSLQYFSLMCSSQTLII